MASTILSRAGFADGRTKRCKLIFHVRTVKPMLQMAYHRHHMYNQIYVYNNSHVTWKTSVLLNWCGWRYKIQDGWTNVPPIATSEKFAPNGHDNSLWFSIRVGRCLVSQQNLKTAMLYHVIFSTVHIVCKYNT